MACAEELFFGDGGTWAACVLTEINNAKRNIPGIVATKYAHIPGRKSDHDVERSPSDITKILPFSSIGLGKTLHLLFRVFDVTDERFSSIVVGYRRINLRSSVSAQDCSRNGYSMMRTNFICQLLLLAGAIFAPLGRTQNPKPAEAPPIARFVDVAAKAGLSAPNVFGGVDTKKYIIETTGTGVAIFDFDNDLWPDIFLVNGNRGQKNIKKIKRKGWGKNGATEKRSNPAQKGQLVP